MPFRKYIIIAVIVLAAFLAGFILSSTRSGRTQAGAPPETKITYGANEPAAASSGPEMQPAAPGAVVSPDAVIKRKAISRPPFPQFQKGMTYVTWDRMAYSKGFSDLSLSKLSSIGCEYAAIITTWYQGDYNMTQIKPGGNTPTDDSVVHAIEQAHKAGLKVMLKPHLDLIKSGCWRGEIQFCNDVDWETWFKSYGEFITHYAELAEENGVEIFCIGVELTVPAVEKPEMWDAYVIQPVRKVFSGPITYAANWNEEYQNIAFWDKLDYAGLDAYFPLSENEKPSIDDLRQGWKVHMEAIEAWQKKINKPVLLTEVGYKSSTGAAKAPWEHQLGREVDLELQKDCYTAMLEAFWGKPWFYGMYWWYWGTNDRMGGSTDRGFNIQNKPAQDAVKEWYGKTR